MRAAWVFNSLTATLRRDACRVRFDTVWSLM
jgi:hypothetical protein